MSEPSDLSRMVQEFADALRGIRPEHLTEEERADLRAVLVELTWLAGPPQPREPY